MVRPGSMKTVGSLEECGYRLEQAALSCKESYSGLKLGWEVGKLGEARGPLRILCMWSETVSYPPPWHPIPHFHLQWIV